jgi:hypothetical protein
MLVSTKKVGYHVSSRTQRLDRRQECRFMLALIMLMGCATASVVATTQHDISDQQPRIVLGHR